MKLPETRSAVLLELGSWENIIHSDDWLAFRRLLKEHTEYLQNEVNECLGRHEDRKAGEALRAMRDCNKIIDLVNKRITALRGVSEVG